MKSHYVANGHQFSSRKAAMDFLRVVCAEGTPRGQAFRGSLFSVDDGGSSVPLAYFKGEGGSRRLREERGW